MAATEIQVALDQMIAAKNDIEIIRKIKTFSQLCEEENVIRRRAGLYGISVISVSLFLKVRVESLMNELEISY